MNGMKFSTFDVDNNFCSTCSNCADFTPRRGGWWYNNCYMNSLTGETADMRWDTMDPNPNSPTFYQYVQMGRMLLKYKQ